MNIPAETLLVVATAVLIAGSATLVTLLDRATSAWRECWRDRADLSYAVENYPGSIHAAELMRHARASRRRAYVAACWPPAVGLLLLVVLYVLATWGLS